MTAGNWGPVASGATTGPLAVTLTATSTGALIGQTIHIRNNFDNTNSQDLAIQGAGYNLAVGSTTPSPVTLANQRVGGSVSQVLTVANVAPGGAFTEVLNASFGSNTGAATNNGGSISGGLGTGGVAVGTPNSTAMAVGVNTVRPGGRPAR